MQLHPNIINRTKQLFSSSKDINCAIIRILPNILYLLTPVEAVIIRNRIPKELNIRIARRTKGISTMKKG